MQCPSPSPQFCVVCGAMWNTFPVAPYPLLEVRDLPKLEQPSPLAAPNSRKHWQERAGERRAKGANKHSYKALPNLSLKTPPKKDGRRAAARSKLSSFEEATLQGMPTEPARRPQPSKVNTRASAPELHKRAEDQLPRLIQASSPSKPPRQPLLPLRPPAPAAMPPIVDKSRHPLAYAPGPFGHTSKKPPGYSNPSSILSSNVSSPHGSLPQVRSLPSLPGLNRAAQLEVRHQREENALQSISSVASRISEDLDSLQKRKTFLVRSPAP